MLSLAYLGGHPEAFSLLALFLLAYGIHAFLGTPGAFRRRILLLAAMAGIVFLGMVAIHLLPFLEFAFATTRAAILRPSVTSTNIITVAAEALFPTQRGSWSMWNLSVIAILLALFAAPPNRTKVFFLGVATVSAITALPWLPAALHGIPLFSNLFRYNDRVSFFFVLALSILAGYGVKALREGRRLSAPILFLLSAGIVAFGIVFIPFLPLVTTALSLCLFVIAVRFFPVARILVPLTAVLLLLSAAALMVGHPPRREWSYGAFRQAVQATQASLDAPTDRIAMDHPALVNAVLFDRAYTTDGYDSLAFAAYDALPRSQREYFLSATRKLAGEQVNETGSRREPLPKVFLAEEGADTPRQKSGGERIVLADYAPERVAIDLTVKKAGLAVLSDIHASGWHAVVDGEERPIVSFAGVLRGVPVRPGDTRVIFIYRPWLFLLGAIVTISTLTAIAAWLLGRSLHIAPFVFAQGQAIDKGSVLGYSR